jgi:hypothetical protein
MKQTCHQKNLSLSSDTFLVEMSANEHTYASSAPDPTTKLPSQQADAESRLIADLMRRSPVCSLSL